MPVRAPKRKAAQAPAEVADALALDLLTLVLQKKLAISSPLPPGLHQVRGLATLDVDAWVEKAAPGEQAKAWPIRDILLVALRLACPGQERLLRLLKDAAAEVLGGEPVEAGHVAVCLDAVHTEILDQLPKLPREGATKVTGEVKVVALSHSPLIRDQPDL
jgi:hypothetical protein